jgi:hypothetical protein
LPVAEAAVVQIPAKALVVEVVVLVVLELARH